VRPAAKLKTLCKMASSPFQHQSADVRPGAFGLAIANDNELFSLVALRFAPKPAIPWNVRRVHPLRDDALCLGSARGLQEALAIADMMIAVLNGSRRAFEDGFQAFLSFEKG
jgi:hypothetical protein